MNSDIVKQIGIELNLDEKKIINVLSLLEEGNTIPFIARYRKEATGNMDEDNIKRINEYYEYQVNLLKRKEDVIRLKIYIDHIRKRKRQKQQMRLIMD